MTSQENLSRLRMDNGKLPAFAWPGGYQLYYLTADNACLCPDCANGANGSDATERNRKMRDWECLNYCVKPNGTMFQWSSPVTISENTPNISGESTEFCPNCDGRNVHGSPAYDSTDKEWLIVACDVHYEGPDMYCDHCSGTIESAYGDPDENN